MKRRNLWFHLFWNLVTTFFGMIMIPKEKDSLKLYLFLQNIDKLCQFLWVMTFLEDVYTLLL